jgi:two-component system, OmpR family, copper resistance phosphate regulon response regulator CusR
MMRILVVEDEPRIAGFLRRGLREEGYDVDVTGDLAAARAAVEHGPPDLILVDRLLPDGDGLDLVRDVHRREPRIPSICLTARDRVADRVDGLRGGADDYVVKPFSFEEILARIEAVTRRRAGPQRIEVADLVVDVCGRQAWRAGRELRLTAREFDLLRALAGRAGEVLERAHLLQEVWATRRDPGTNVVEVYVSYLRAKLDRGFDPPLLHTVRGVGYVLAVRS